jgi:hypothetical protein
LILQIFSDLPAMVKGKNTDIVAFIEAIEAKPALWDKSNGDYSDKVKVADAWSDIASSCGYDGTFLLKIFSSEFKWTGSKKEVGKFKASSLQC